MQPISSPFPYFGGKRKVAAAVWERLGPCANYIEPFFGSGAVLLARPDDPKTETINDADGLVSNFWRALQADYAAVAAFADWPVNENDLHARHAWLVSQKDSLQTRLEGDPTFYDAKIAGWWVWGMACWIGSGFCSGHGPWRVEEIDGTRQLVHVGNQGQGVNRQLVHVGDQGQGVNRQLVHVGDQGRGVARKRVSAINEGRGVNRGANASTESLTHYFSALADRLRRVRVCCGDWSRICGPSVTHKHGLTAVFLDPPYADTASRTDHLYRVDSSKVAHEVREWAITEGKNPLMRIALCGYESEHQMPADWSVYAWNAGEGFGGQAKERSQNGKRERIWFSPHCLTAKEPDLFGHS